MHSLKGSNTIQSLYRKFPLIRAGRIFGQRTNLIDLYSGDLHMEGAGYIRKEKHFNLQSAKHTFLFSSIKHVFCYFFTSCKMWNMFKNNNKETRIRKVNDKVKNKESVDVVLASLLLTLNIFHFLLQCFYCSLWSVNYRLGLLFVVLRLCGCWNKLRQSFPLWRNYVTKLH